MDSCSEVEVFKRFTVFEELWFGWALSDAFIIAEELANASGGSAEINVALALALPFTVIVAPSVPALKMSLAPCTFIIV